jgi:hypothetical protein
MIETIETEMTTETEDHRVKVLVQVLVEVDHEIIEVVNVRTVAAEAGVIVTTTSKTVADVRRRLMMLTTM